METQTNQSTQNNESRIRKVSTENPISVSRVWDGNYKKDGQQQAELRQEVITKSFYPSKKISNNMQDNIFGAGDFGATHQEHEFENKETRVAFLPVPEGMTPEQVTAKIAANSSARLYKVLSNRPILTEDQTYAINAGLRTEEEFANSQVVRYPDNEQTQRDGTAGKIVLDPAGKPQYRSIFFTNSGAEDKDLRTPESTDFFASEEILSAIANKVHVEPEQTL